MLKVDFYYTFGELSSGDWFVWEGECFRKVSGNYAECLRDGLIVEFKAEARVYLYKVN